MRRVLCFALCMLAVLSLAGCGNVKDVQIAAWEPSGQHSDSEINAALRAARRVFSRCFDGCTLTELSYSEEKSTPAEITILAAFDVDSTGGPDGVLDPDSHYTNYKFTFTRAFFGVWKLADNGYA